MTDLPTRLIAIGAELVLPMGLILYTEKRGTDWVLRVGDPNATDNVTGEPMAWKGRKWLLSEHMTDGEIVQTAFLATLTAIEHEIRETFTFRGAAIFDPHYDIQKLVDLRLQPDALKERS
jgi:hypothetical protein